MPKFLIRGGVPLKGEVKISGSKNAALPILAATILLDKECIIENVPNLLDIISMLKVLRALGKKAEYVDGTVKIWGNNIRHVAPYELVTKMRASFFVIGPILAKNLLAKVPLPGGCAIGARPVDIHIKGLEALGAESGIEHGFVIVKAKKLKGASIYLNYPSVGATETIMMAAVLAEGETIIENAAQEPEIVCLADFLISCGAQIIGQGTDKIVVNGVKKLSGTSFKVMPDRIEAGTFAVAAAASHGEVLIRDFPALCLESVINKLKEIGLQVYLRQADILVKSNGKLKPTDIKTYPYPGFPTDMHPQFAALLSTVDGTSVVEESVFENRFMYANELIRMGANIKIKGNSAIITGVEKLSSAPVRVPDLRGGAALVIAALLSQGETLIDDCDSQLERGYENVVEKLVAMGAFIKRINSFHINPNPNLNANGNIDGQPNPNL